MEAAAAGPVLLNSLVGRSRVRHVADKILSFGFSLAMRNPKRGRSVIPARNPGDPCSTLFHAVERGSLVRRRRPPDRVSSSLPQYRDVALRLVARHRLDRVTIHPARRHWFAAPQIEPQFTRFLFHWLAPSAGAARATRPSLPRTYFYRTVQRAAPTSSCCTR